MNKYLIPGLLVSLISTATLSPLAASDDEARSSKTAFERERERELAKKISRAELADARDEFKLDMENYRDILQVLKKIRHQDDVAEGRRDLKRLLPESNETYERMANNSQEADEDDEVNEDTLPVGEIRAQRAYDQIKQEYQKEYDKLIAALSEQLERLYDSDVQSYELTQMLDRIDEDIVGDTDDSDDSDDSED